MKEALLRAVIFFCLPVTIVISIVIRQHSAYYGRPASEWFQEMKTGEPSPGLERLKQMGTAAVPALQDALRSPEPSQMFRALWALGQMGPLASNAVPDLVEMLGRSDPALRNSVMRALKSIGTTRADFVPRMLEKLNDPNECAQAADLLERIEQDRLACQLPPVWKDQYEYAMAFARAATPAVRLRALPKLPPKDERSLAAFESLLNDPNPWTREQTAAFMKSHNIAVTNKAGPKQNASQS